MKSTAPGERRYDILEMDGSGHRLAYVALIAARAHQRGFRVVLHTSRGLEVRYEREYRAHISPLVAAQTIRVKSHDRVAGAQLLEFAKASSVLAIPSGDRWLATVARIRGQLKDVRLLVMRPIATSGSGRVRLVWKRILAEYLASKSNSKVGMLAIAGSRARPKWRGVTPVADPVLSRSSDMHPSDAKSKFGLSPSAFVLGIFGVVGPRKNPELLYQALADAAEVRGARATLFIPGSIGSESLNALQLMRSDLVDVQTGDGYLSPEDYADAFRAVDVIGVVHDNEGSSGVITDATSMGVPILAAGVESVVRQAEAYEFGFTASKTVSSLSVRLQLLMSGQMEPQTKSRGHTIQDLPLPKFFIP